jgi:uncharacterized protein (UPF0248 family)
MIPIRELHNRIRWDRQFAAADFRIGYYDRVDETIIVVPLNQVVQEPGDCFAVRVLDHAGVSHLLPYHRIREVYRNDELIWKRGRSVEAARPGAKEGG